jgi:hypothetical protein
MKRGTTPTLRFSLPFVPDTDINALYITFQQRGETIIEKSLEEVTVDGENVLVRLTQEDTLNLDPKADVNVQLRFRIGDNAYASDVMPIHIGRILKDGII